MVTFEGPKYKLLFSDDSKFSEAVQTLLTWIERGEVNRRSANNFYSMIQSANSHVRRLVNEKAAHEKDMEEAKENFKQALSGILIQCEWKLELCWKNKGVLYLVTICSTQEHMLIGPCCVKGQAFPLPCLVLFLYSQMPELWFHLFFCLSILVFLETLKLQSYPMILQLWAPMEA